MSFTALTQAELEREKAAFARQVEAALRTPDIQPGDTVRVPRHGVGVAVDAIPYAAEVCPTVEVNHPAVEETVEIRYRAASKFIHRLEHLLRWRKFYDCEGRLLDTPMDVVNAILAGRWPVRSAGEENNPNDPSTI